MNGIPRLLERDFYWGEIEQTDARRLVEEASTLGWKTAVGNRFSETDAAWISILDWQRASWIPLLALPKESVVLDIGSGYGAITHALAAHFDEVHSIEAIPERVEFTYQRVSQEGFDNVHLVQGSALQLPYPAASFDAIVVNGVLEWIGDWDLEGTPRSAQLRFLRRLHTLLKPSGRLLVGIENRFGYVSIGGAVDHSGLPYTNLLPRPLATAAIRLFSSHHHRMKVSSPTYRTYTYSASGFHKLFRDADFTRSDCYWVEPGYNLPYGLYPLTRASVAKNLDEMQTEAAVGRPLSFTARAKRVLARVGVLQQLVPEFVFVVSNNATEGTRWDALLPSEISPAPQFHLSTRKFGTKTTLRAYTDKHRGVVLKYSTPAQGSKDRVATEYAVMEIFAAKLAEHPKPPFSVSTPLGSHERGAQLVTVESRAAGEQVSTLLYKLPAWRRLSFLRAQFPRLAEAASTIATMSRDSELDGLPAVSWIAHAEPVIGAALAGRGNALRGKYSEWSGHGDFTVENILFDAKTKRMTVIDWEFVRSGLPPLYDLFALVLSVLSVVVPPASVSATVKDPALAQFYTAFFHKNEWSALFGDCIRRECDRLGLDPDQTWEMFIDALILRIGYLVERKSALSISRVGFIESIQEWREQFQF